jgi:acetoacetyl-CoA synthetase
MRNVEVMPMWTPTKYFCGNANISRFIAWVDERFDLELKSYHELWTWSVDDLDRFWIALWDYFAIGSPVQPGAGLANADMPGAKWFPGERLNFAQQVLQRAPKDGAAVIHFDASLNQSALSREELSERVMQCADAMRASGIGVGDRIVACMPNVPETIVALLAAASIGAIWSVVSPETGAQGMLARFAQLEPKLFVAADAYTFRGAVIDRREEVAKVVEGLPSLEQVIVFPQGARDSLPLAASFTWWQDFLARGRKFANVDQFEFAAVGFDHPLWVLFSSGTTGIPKAMLQSHGGILLEMLKTAVLHLDLHPGERLFFYTITGWMVWNLNFAALLAGAAIIVYDGHPTEPDVGQLWRIAEAGKVNVFGGSPSYAKMLMQANYCPREHHDLSAMREILLSGSPASPECMRWFLESVKGDLWVQSACGGTDVCTSFVGGVPILPVFAGEIQARWLGVDAVALDEDGNSVIDEVGELVIRQPMPSMPVKFWKDPDGARYQETYFDLFPGKWRQGDFVEFNARGGVHILGRSDATLNRHGVRIGTAEIYRSLESLSEISDALVVNVDLPGGECWMLLFVKLVQGASLDDTLSECIRRHLKASLSPRHVPDDIVAVSGIPYTKTGKRLEVPVRRILNGAPVDKVVARETTEDFPVLTALLEVAWASIPREGSRR